MNIIDVLKNNKDDKYAEFQVKLTPGISLDNVLGVRVPILRKIANVFIKEKESSEFLNKLPHKYYDEYMLHSILLSKSNNYDDCIIQVDKFLSFIDNWAVCDTLSPNVFKKYKKELIPKIEEWIASKDTYTCRFGIKMLMSLYLDNDFDKKYLKMVSKIRSDEYYINMMIAWYFATALAKQWDDTIIYLENNKLDKWVHNKTIQKAKESFRVSEEHKLYLNSLKIK